jgi:DNA-directed RNA polymerase subunit M
MPQASEAPARDAPDDTVVILDAEQTLNTAPTVHADCEECHNNRAYVWQVQTRSADEGAIQFFRGTKCGHTWRQYT